MKAEPIKQDTAPPLMMYGRDKTQLAALGWDALGLYWSAMMWLVDGGNGYLMVVPTADLHLAAERRLSAKALEKAAAELVARGVWAVTETGYEVVLHHQPAIDTWRNPTQRARWLRDKQLNRDSDLLQRIKDRDRLLCRYCGVRTRWDGDQRSKISGSYDHVDPDGSNSFENVVIACRHCNCTLKKDRTLEQAGMSLYRAGTTADDIAAGRARPIAGRNAAPVDVPSRKARSDLGAPAGAGDADPDPIPIRSGSWPDPARARPRLRTEPDPTQNGSGSEQPPAGGDPDAPPPWTDEQVDGYVHPLNERLVQ